MVAVTRSISSKNSEMEKGARDEILREDALMNEAVVSEALPIKRLVNDMARIELRRFELIRGGTSF